MLFLKLLINKIKNLTKIQIIIKVATTKNTNPKNIPILWMVYKKPIVVLSFKLFLKITGTEVAIKLPSGDLTTYVPINDWENFKVAKALIEAAKVREAKDGLNLVLIILNKST